ncbi:hypothetical protein HY388_01785 [Candidatus Daviesbacteria bacterium]|nr:hypothetical protein [Candidatus Daviesbacteria bacterium]
MNNTYQTRQTKLSKKEEERIYKRILISTILSLLLLFVILNWGIRLLVGIADAWDILRGGRQTPITNNLPLFPPRLDSLPNATNSAQITIYGFATPGSNVELFLNGQTVGKKLVAKDNNFEFPNLTLQEGENRINAIATNDKGETSQPSPTATIMLKNKAPKIIVNTPAEGSTFSGSTSEIQVFGKAEGATQVTVGGFWATLLSDGTFSYNLKLAQGENKISITAADDAGNKTVHERTVVYNP